MMYLIGQLAIWLLFTAFFAALVGWAVAYERALPQTERLHKDRDKMLGELSALASGEGRSEGVINPNAEADRSLAAIREARLAELERTAQEQRARADALSVQLAEAQRGARNADDVEELKRLRQLVAAHEEERARIVDTVATPAPPPPPPEPSEDVQLQAWRLRYFERRVKYLEGLQTPAAPPTLPVAEIPPPEPEVQPPTAEWRAREAEARASFLADELRRAETPAPTPEPEPAPPEEPVSPFAANADVDVLLRWRMLYLERRVAHLQAQAAAVPEPASEPEPEPVAAPVAEAAPDMDRWKWRARYLESRVRYLETRPTPSAVQAVAAPVVEAAPAPPAPPPAERPPGLPAAHGGAPDDFTLIEDISPLQQNTLYSLGIYHFDQMALWTPANVAWVDRYLRLQGRIVTEEWVEQAADLAREGVEASRRISEDETA